MYFVVHSANIAFFRKLKEFTFDLGVSVFTVTNEHKRSLTFQDTNVSDYGNKYERIIHKIGNIGAIKIYTDDSLHVNQIRMFEKSFFLEKDINREQFNFNTREYINTLIRELTKQDEEPKRPQLTMEERIRIARSMKDE